MKTITAQNLRNTITGVLPQCLPFTSATGYEIPHLDEVKRFLRENEVDRLPFIDGVLECELYALFLFTDMKEKMVKRKKVKHWAFGFAFGLMWNGEVAEHTANVFVAHNKGKINVYCCEPQTDEVWILNPLRDIIFKIDFL